MKIKTGDTVMVITGHHENDVGKKGKVLKVDPDNGRIVVQGRRMVTRHTKARKQGDPSGRIQKEAFIDASNVMLVCPKCNKPARVGYAFEAAKDGKQKKVRICKKCQKAID